jgi:V-type H+-transporting ATPase subunit e
MEPIAIPFIVMSAFWGAIGILLPWCIPKGPNRGIAQVILVETSVACYLFWVCTYLMQLNPLIGPQLSNTTIYVIQQEWAKN